MKVQIGSARENEDPITVSTRNNRNAPIHIRIGEPQGKGNSRNVYLSPSHTRQLAHLLLAAAEEATRDSQSLIP